MGRPLIGLLALLLGALALSAQQAPALVATDTVRSGTINPLSHYVGTLHFHALSDVANESAGAVSQIAVQAGDTVKANQVLAVLDSAILEATIAATQAEFIQASASAKQADRDLARHERLYEQNSISAHQLEQERLKAQQLNAQADRVAANLKALEIELQKRTIRAPFEGVITARHTQKGEWLSVGATVATLAQHHPMEVLIHVSSRDLALLEPKQSLPVRIQDRQLTGTVAGIIPLADASSRTFPVRIRIELPDGLTAAQGIQADVGIPQPIEKEALLVHRDAIITRFNQQVVFAVIDDQAQMIPVEVVGSDGLLSAVKGPRLEAGMAVITRGNERIFPNQPVKVQP